MSRNANSNSLLAAVRSANAKELLEQDDNGHTFAYSRSIPTDTLVLSALNSKLPSQRGNLSSSISTSKDYNQCYIIGAVDVGNNTYRFLEEADRWRNRIICTALHTITDPTLSGSSSLLVSKDVEAFFRDYPASSLTTADIADVCSIDETNHPGTLDYKFLVGSALSTYGQDLHNESTLESFLDLQISRLIMPWLQLSFMKMNAADGNLEMSFEKVCEMYDKHVKMGNKVAVYPAADSNVQRCATVDMGVQRTLKALNIWGIGDIVCSLAQQTGAPSYSASFMPLFVFSIIEVKQSLFTETVRNVLESLEGNPEVKGGKLMSRSGIDFDSSTSFGKVLNKLIQQLVRSQSTKGLLIDGSYMLFIELTRYVNVNGITGVKIYGPFSLFHQKGLRMMCLAFLSFTSGFEEILKDKEEMLKVANEMKLYSSSEISSANVPSVIREEEEEVEEEDKGGGGNDEQQEELSWKNLDVEFKSDSASTDECSESTSHQKSSASTEATAPEINTTKSLINSPPRSSARLPVQHPTSKVPYYDPSELVVYDINFLKYRKYLMYSENLAFIFKISPKFLESFPRSNLNIDDHELKELMEEVNVDKWPILKLYPPDCWDEDVLDEKLPLIREGNDDHYPINLMGISCDQVIKEVKIMNKLSSSPSFESTGIPKVIVSGVMRDMSKEESKENFSVLNSSFHGGFILMDDVGKSLTDDKMMQLDVETKTSILDMFEKMHELDVVHGDVRAENIVLKSKEVNQAGSNGALAAYIIDFGNSIITKDKSLKGEDQGKLEELLGFF